jgi:hypothetical protein
VAGEGPGIWTPGGEYRPQAQQPPEEREELTPEQVAQLMRELRIEDFLLSNVSTLAQLGYTKLDREALDLGQARLAIDALGALLGVLQGTVPADVSRDFGQVLSNLRLAYARAVDEPPAGA